MRDRGLSAIHMVCEQADNKADAVLLDSYSPGYFNASAPPTISINSAVMPACRALL